MADDTDDTGVNQTLSHLRADFRVALIIFRDQFEFDLLAANRHAFGIQVFDGEFGAILVVLAQVGNGARHRRDLTDLDHGFTAGICRGRCRRAAGRSLLVFVAASRKGHYSGSDEAQASDVSHSYFP